MVSKVQERIYAEEAAALLATDWTLHDIPEPLDFEVRTANETFGLEVRQVFGDAEARFGSPAKRNESKNIQAVSHLAKRYYDSRGRPISANFLGALSPANSDAVLKLMLAFAPTYPGSNATLEAPAVKVFMSPLPKSFARYSRWTFVRDRVGWVRRMSDGDLQNVVDRKAENLQHYKKKYDRIELLLVADRRFNSGKLIPSALTVLRNPGFQSIYFMSYPESIHRVG